MYRSKPCVRLKGKTISVVSLDLYATGQVSPIPGWPFSHRTVWIKSFGIPCEQGRMTSRNRMALTISSPPAHSTANVINIMKSSYAKTDKQHFQNLLNSATIMQNNIFILICCPLSGYNKVYIHTLSKKKRGGGRGEVDTYSTFILTQVHNRWSSGLVKWLYFFYLST